MFGKNKNKKDECSELAKRYNKLLVDSISSKLREKKESFIKAQMDGFVKRHEKPFSPGDVVVVNYFRLLTQKENQLGYSPTGREMVFKFKNKNAAFTGAVSLAIKDSEVCDRWINDKIDQFFLEKLDVFYDGGTYLETPDWYADTLYNGLLGYLRSESPTLDFFEWVSFIDWDKCNFTKDNGEKLSISWYLNSYSLLPVGSDEAIKQMEMTWLENEIDSLQCRFNSLHKSLHNK
jgi:hypothetical protein